MADVHPCFSRLLMIIKFPGNTPKFFTKYFLHLITSNSDKVFMAYTGFTTYLKTFVIFTLLFKTYT